MNYSCSLAILLFLPLSVTAEDIDVQINKACLRHAVSLTGQLKSGVIGEVSKAQSDQILKLATESCQAYFSREFSNATVASTTNPEQPATATERKSSGDVFTDLIFQPPVRKDGNKRLMKKR